MCLLSQCFWCIYLLLSIAKAEIKNICGFDRCYMWRKKKSDSMCFGSQSVAYFIVFLLQLMCTTEKHFHIKPNDNRKYLMFFVLWTLKCYVLVQTHTPNITLMYMFVVDKHCLNDDDDDHSTHGKYFLKCNDLSIKPLYRTEQRIHIHRVTNER